MAIVCECICAHYWHYYYLLSRKYICIHIMSYIIIEAMVVRAHLLLLLLLILLLVYLNFILFSLITQEGNGLARSTFLSSVAFCLSPSVCFVNYYIFYYLALIANNLGVQSRALIVVDFLYIFVIWSRAQIAAITVSLVHTYSCVPPPLLSRIFLLYFVIIYFVLLFVGANNTNCSYSPACANRRSFCELYNFVIVLH